MKTDLEKIRELKRRYEIWNSKREGFNIQLEAKEIRERNEAVCGSCEDCKKIDKICKEIEK